MRESESLPSPGSGAHGSFATTHWSLILSAGASESSQATSALESLCRSYWSPIYTFVRRMGHAPEDARDLTQQFFACLLAKGWLNRADPLQGRFRNFLLTYLKRFLSDEGDRASALKRGGGQVLLSLDQLANDEEHSFEPSTHLTPEREFDRRWSLATLDNALGRLRSEATHGGQGELFAALEPHLSGEGGLEKLAAIGPRFGVGESAIKMRLSRWRERFRELIYLEVARTVPRASDIDEEVRQLMEALSD